MQQTRISNHGTAKLFESRFLEKLTRTQFTIPVTIFFLISLGCIVYAALYTDQKLIRLVYLFPAGLVVFTLVEYLIHRFLFHFSPHTEAQARVRYNIHGVHHEYPKDKDRLAMPPLISISVALLFYFLFRAIMGETVWLFFSGFTAGYSIYLIIHYAVHRYRPPANFLRYLWKHHSLHHYKSDEAAFSVSFPIWDILFGTMPDLSSKKDAAAGSKLPDYNS